MRKINCNWHQNDEISNIDLEISETMMRDILRAIEIGKVKLKKSDEKDKVVYLQLYKHESYEGVNHQNNFDRYRNNWY
jgi:hypothetical protein